MTDAIDFKTLTKNYFVRPHQSVPTKPVVAPAAWRGAELKQDPARWQRNFEPEHIDELTAIADVYADGGLPSVAEAHAQLGSCHQLVSECRQQLSEGLGFVLLRGLPVQDWSEAGASAAYWAFGLLLGQPGVQNPQGELLGHVKDYGEEATQPMVRRYRTTGNIDFHCDAADVVGLCCLRASTQGGESRVASSVTVFNELLSAEPALARRLFEPFFLDRRDEQLPGQPPCSQLQPACYADGVLRTFYHSEYFRSADRHDGYQLDPQTLACLDAYDRIAENPEIRLDMQLAPGDVQFVNNHTVVHGRAAYVDGPDGPDGPEGSGRHLLRLWLTL